MNLNTLKKLKRSRGTGLWSAFTLAEMMVTMGVFSLVVLGLVYTHLFGLREDELINSKLGASEESRRALSQLTGEVRSAKIWTVGTGSATSFTPIANGTTQQGNALQFSRSTDTTSYIRYWFDTKSCELHRMQSGVSGYTVIAQYLTNRMYFQAEDYLGNVKTDLSYKYLIHVIMEFSQYQYPLTQVGPGYFYDYYKMEFKITPHCPDGA